MKSILFITLILVFVVSSSFAKENPSHTAIVKSVSISSDSKKVASISANELKIWDVESGKSLYQYKIGGVFVKIMPDNKTLIVVSDTAKLIDMETGQVKKKFNSGEFKLKGKAASSSDGKLLACNTTECNILIFDTETGSRISPNLDVSNGDYSFVRSIAFSKDNKTLLVCESRDKRYIRIDLSTFEMKIENLNNTMLSVEQSDKFIFLGYIYSLSGGNNFTAKYVSTGVEMHYEDKHSVVSMAYHPTNTNMLANGTLFGLMIWDVEKGKSKKLKGHTSQINDIEFSPDGKFIISCSGDLNPDVQDFTVRMWDVEKMKAVKVFAD